jgi:hypothetical protein
VRFERLILLSLCPLAVFQYAQIADTTTVPEQWNCTLADVPCTRQNNQGWRYVMFTGGALVFVMSILRITVIRLRETPKYLLGMGEDDKVVETFQYLATKYNRPCSLTVEKLEACGTVRGTHSESRFSVSETLTHLRGLFATNKMALSTLMIWLSWALIGLAYPLFYVFLRSALPRDLYLALSSHDFSLTCPQHLPGKQRRRPRHNPLRPMA